MFGIIIESISVAFNILAIMTAAAVCVCVGKFIITFWEKLKC